VLTGERTREERDAEGRKRAIDLDSGAGNASKVTKVEEAASSSGSAISAPAAAAPGGSAAGLVKVAGLAQLVAHLSANHQAMALKWCEENDADSVHAIVMTEMDDAFIASMSLKVGGVNEVLLRKRLAAIRDAMAEA